jgi:exonuclease III
MHSCDILCLTETWLRPEELSLIDNVFNDNADFTCSFNVFAKSSMNAIDSDGATRGRPYGGLAIICKCSDDLLFNEVTVPHDRLQALKVCNANGTVVHSILNAYMPYFAPTLTEEYVSTLDQAQALIDNLAPLAPIKIVGDFNAQLPKTRRLHARWERSSGFTAHSKILYDFFVANEMSLCDLSFFQPVDHTYFCLSRSVFSWIDHVASSAHDSGNVSKCVILPLCADNLSDHLPIITEFTVLTEVSKPQMSTGGQHPRFARPCWRNSDRNRNYENLVSSRLSAIPLIPEDLLLQPRDVIQSTLDQTLSDICSTLHSSARDAGITPARLFKPKRFWCPDLSLLRNRKRFWWSIWHTCGRPRTGQVFDCWKHAKRAFRSACRHFAHNAANKGVRELNALYSCGNLTGFWRKLARRSQAPSSSLGAADFADHYKSIMCDEDPDLTAGQHAIATGVKSYESSLAGQMFPQTLTPPALGPLLRSLKVSSAPGPDGITAEHLTFALRSDLLLDHLSRILNYALAHTVVPRQLQQSVIVPVLKKATLDPNQVSNYRPITISSVFAKICEKIMMPCIDDTLCETQFGFRPGRDTLSACSFMNDLLCYFNSHGSPVYMCSLDAEKCFDRIWHDGLFCKLRDVLPPAHWLFLREWYNSSSAHVRWNTVSSFSFHPSRGTKQGSLLSPLFFNVFIDDLLSRLHRSPFGLRMGSHQFSSMAYADDISLVAAQPQDLQELISICADYASHWRFSFGIKKSRCMIAGKCPLMSGPSWTLHDKNLDVVDELSILGVTFTPSLNEATHYDKRAQACRRSMFGLSQAGSMYPGLCAEAKLHLWRCIGLPTLTYGLCALPLTPPSAKMAEKAQSDLMKCCFGLRKRSHHSRFLSALGLPAVSDSISAQCQSLLNRLCRFASPARTLNFFLLGRLLSRGDTTPGTLVSRILSAGVSPISILYHGATKSRPPSVVDGVVDSLHSLLFSENYCKPWSAEFLMTALLTSAF